MNKTVLILTSPFRPNVGGVETHLDDLIKEGVKRNLNFKVIAYQPLITNAQGRYIERLKGSDIYRIPWPRYNLFLILEKYPLLEFLYLFPGLYFAGFLYLLFNRKNISVIHSQGLAAGAGGMILGKIFNIRNIISTHSIYHFPKMGIYSRFVKYIFNGSYKILTLSEQSKEEVVGLGVSETKVGVFTYWVDQKIFKPENKIQVRSILKLPKKDLIVLFVGRLVEVKGIRELLTALKNTNENIKIVIAGDGPLAGLVKEYAKENKNLLFMGKVENKVLPLYYNASDVLIIPSTHEEGFGRVILESLSCGSPVIGANRGAIPEAMDESVGFLIDVTPDNISNLLNRLYKDKSILVNKSKKARAFALKKYGEDNIKKIINYY